MRTVLVEAMDAIREHRLAFRDTMPWATARLSGVEFVNPFAADAAPDSRCCSKHDSHAGRVNADPVQSGFRLS